MVINFNRKRRRIAIVAIIAIAFIISIFFIYNSENQRRVDNLGLENKKNSYTIDIVFNDKEKLMKCNQNTTYINSTGRELDRIYFHIYPNAFYDEASVPFEKKDFKKAYPNGFDSGYIEIENLLNNKTNLNYNILGDKKDILEVVLNEILEPNEEISIDIKYDIKIPSCMGRFGYGENTINITNWFPICCVYDKDWCLESYETIGDPFYSEISDFNVSIMIPKKYEIASTGFVTDEKSSDKQKLYKLKAKGVRDFAIVLSDKFIVNKSMCGDISIMTYSLDKNMATISNKFARQAIATFNEMFGEYPYDSYSVVASDFFIGGMEYPNLVMIDERIYSKKRLFLLEYVIAHETAHQWWYGVVGNDEVNSPWIDEALTEYSTVLYFQEKYGENFFNDMIKTMELQSKNYNSYNMFRASKDFKNSSDYSLNVYTKGAIVFNEVRKAVGDELFFDTLKKYYEAYKFKNVNKDEFISFWRNEGIDIEKIIDKLE